MERKKKVEKGKNKKKGIIDHSTFQKSEGAVLPNVSPKRLHFIRESALT
jgi:hypothetical protein